MDIFQSTNSVERRVLKLNEDWCYFTRETEAKLLYWQLSPTDYTLIQTFFQVQQEQACGVLHNEEQFIRAEQYYQQIIQQLYDFYDTRREGSKAKNISADWQLPTQNKQQKESERDYFFRILESLSDYHPDIFPFFTFVLKPYQFSSEDQFADWFIDILIGMQKNEWVSTHVRFVSYGESEQWILLIEEKAPAAICLLQRDLKSQNIPKELLAESSDRSPGADLKRIFVELIPIVAEKNPQKLSTLVNQALTICQQNHWYDQMVVMHLISGAAYLGWKMQENSLTSYQHATQAARKAAETNHPAGNKLVANSLFGEASVWLYEKQHSQAAYCYAQIPSYTLAAEDYILTVEALRMQAYCWQEANMQEQSIIVGLQALDAGKKLEPDLRLNCSLPIAAEALTRQVNQFHEKFNEMNQKLIDIFGIKWQEALLAFKQ